MKPRNFIPRKFITEHIADIFLGMCPTIVEDSGSYSIGVSDVAGFSDTRQIFSNFSLPNALILMVATDHRLHNTAS